MPSRRSGHTRRRQRTPAAQAGARRAGRPRRGNIKKWTTRGGETGFGARFLDQHRVRQYERLGLESEGWSDERAVVALERFLEEVQAGAYVRSVDVEEEMGRDPLLGEFAPTLLREHAIEVDDDTAAFHENMWRNHLEPWFGHFRLSQVVYDVIRAYKLERQQLIDQIDRAAARGIVLRGPEDRPMKLSPRTINHAIGTLSFILGSAARRRSIGISVNEASSRDLRVSVPRTEVRDWLEPDEVIIVLEAAERVDGVARPDTLRKAQRVRELRDDHKLTVKETAYALGISEGGVCWLYERRQQEKPSTLRALVGTLAMSGARNAEVCRLRPRDLDFVHGKVRVPRAKTKKGVREIDMSPWLRRQLAAHVASLGPDYSPAGRLFPNRRGGFYNKDSLNRRLRSVYREVVKLRAERSLPDLALERLTAHVFRRTYITAMIEAGAPLSYVQDQVGHEDIATTIRIYTRIMRTRDRRVFGRAFDELMMGAVPDPDPAEDDDETPLAA